MEMEIAEVALDDIIAKNNKAKGFRGGRGNERRQNDGPRGGAVSKKSKQWGHDKYFELANGGGRNSGGGGGNKSGRGGSFQGPAFSVCRFSNIPFHITQDELRELFSNYHQLKSVVLHHDDRGNSLGTAEVRGPTKDIERLHAEFNRCRIDGRTVNSVIVRENDGPSRIAQRVTRNGGGGSGGDQRRRSDGGAKGGRRSGGGGGGGGQRAPKKQKLTAEELDRELDEYMKNKTS